jgi:hypothetical protein
VAAPVLLSSSVHLGQGPTSQIHPPHLGHDRRLRQSCRFEQPGAPILPLRTACWGHPALSAYLPDPPSRRDLACTHAPVRIPFHTPLPADQATGNRTPPAMEDQCPRLVRPGLELSNGHAAFRGIDTELMCTTGQSVTPKCSNRDAMPPLYASLRALFGPPAEVLFVFWF